jgi:hypothetical protein
MKFSSLGLKLFFGYIVFGIFITSASVEGSWGGFMLAITSFPISIFSMVIAYYVPTELIAFVFVFIGGVWWYIIGWFIEAKIIKRNRNE